MRKLTIAERIERRQNRISFQNVEGSTVTESTEVPSSNPFATKHKGKFSITVTSDEIDEATKKNKVLYKNEEEPFEYEQVDSLVNALRNEGAKLSDSQIDFISDALGAVVGEDEKETEDSEKTGKAVKALLSIYNAKIKADAKQSAYAGLVNKYKPLEGEKKESAQARMVANAIKLAGISKEAAIEMLIAGKVLPADYTVADFDSTPLRRTKGDSDE